MSIEESRNTRITIEPYYKNNNIFERDQAYYSQMLAGTRRSGSLRNSQRYMQRTTLNDRNPSPPANLQPTPVQTDYRNTTYQPNQNQYHSVVTNRQTIQQQTLQTSQAMQTNMALKKQLEQLVSGRTQFGHSQNVVKLQHYNFNQNDTAKIKQQQNEIRRLESLIESNKQRVIAFKKAGDELSIRMNNIQSIDKEIYKTLQGSVNRDRELLERASSALARGQRREDVAKLLQQILS